VTYVLGGLFLLALLYGASRWFVRADPAQVTTALKVAAVTLGIVGVVLLAVVGRIGLVLMLAGLLILLFIRWRNAPRRRYGHARMRTASTGNVACRHGMLR
jgi:hypothetical protein